MTNRRYTPSKSSITGEEATARGGEYESLHQEGSVEEAAAGDQLLEDPNLAEEDVKAGPSGVVQPPVVVQAVCGGDEPPAELSEYEKLRERNIRERDEAMKEAMVEIDEAKQEMRDNAPGAKKRVAKEEAGGMRKRKKKVEPVGEFRRSGRERKPVNYVVEEDLDGRSRKRGRKVGVGKGKETSSSPVRSGQGKPISMSRSSPTLPSSSRTLRPRKHVDYSEVPEPEADGFIWCSTCNKEEYNGCEKHITYFGDNKEFKLEVEKSSAGRKAGEGVVNRGNVIPEGVLFGPYTGKFIPAAEYEVIKAAKMESGNAWEIRDQFNMKTVGFIDPGMNPDPQLHWMAKINCPSQTEQQNLVGFQLAGQIYYRVMMNIPYGKELLVWYGITYAEEMGIDVETVDRYKGEEDHIEEAIKCEYCGTGMEGENVEEHLGKGDNGVFRCGVKQSMEMVRMADSGERKYVCKMCGKGFKTKRDLSVHANVHSKVKDFKCDVERCIKKFARSSGLAMHKKAVHEGVYSECPECGRRFGKKENMTRHYKSVHDEEKFYKCAKCGLKFSRNAHLTQHIKTVHDKIRAFKCQHCKMSFGRAGARKQHVESVHSHIRYPCTWHQGCTWTTGQKGDVKYHIRRAHTKEWSLECQLCEDQLDIWWGCLFPKEMNKHKAKKHPVEWEEEQEAYRKDHPYVCKYKRCLNRYKTEVEKDRHEVNMH
jgi:uncharacterized C2H2 Zn-finger protein